MKILSIIGTVLMLSVPTIATAQTTAPATTTTGTTTGTGTMGTVDRDDDGFNLGWLGLLGLAGLLGLRRQKVVAVDHNVRRTT